jgi:hypothetical protein
MAHTPIDAFKSCARHGALSLSYKLGPRLRDALQEGAVQRLSPAALLREGLGFCACFLFFFASGFD